MIKLIVGNKGTGKTKVMVDMINENLPQVKGNIVCIEKGMQLTHNIPTSVRLIDVDEFKIKGCKRFYGFFAGVCASNYDIEQIYVDGILKVLEHDMAVLDRHGVVGEAHLHAVRLRVEVTRVEVDLSVDVRLRG